MVGDFFSVWLRLISVPCGVTGSEGWTLKDLCAGWTLRWLATWYSMIRNSTGAMNHVLSMWNLTQAAWVTCRLMAGLSQETCCTREQKYMAWATLASKVILILHRWRKWWKQCGFKGKSRVPSLLNGESPSLKDGRCCGCLWVQHTIHRTCSNPPYDVYYLATA